MKIFMSLVIDAFVRLAPINYRIGYTSNSMQGFIWENVICDSPPMNESEPRQFGLGIGSVTSAKMVKH